ncbi:unnamed protein product [Ixodes hexagonus]
MHPTLVGILLVFGYYCLQDYVGGSGDATAALQTASPSWEELRVANDIRSRLGNGSAWRKTHPDLYVCTSFLDDRTKPTMVRFVVVANMPGQGPSAKRRYYPSFECAFLYR